MKQSRRQLRKAKKYRDQLSKYQAKLVARGEARAATIRKQKRDWIAACEYDGFNPNDSAFVVFSNHNPINNK
jgi:hypothetical protein